MGAAFRLADAAGLSGLILCGTTPRPPHPKIAKTARATERVLPWQDIDNTRDFLAREAQQGALILALEITDESHSLFDFQLPVTANTARPIYLIAGNESVGVSQEVLDLIHFSVHLPMHGQNTSMNVSVALGAAVYLLLQQMQ